MHTRGTAATQTASMMFKLVCVPQLASPASCLVDIVLFDDGRTRLHRARARMPRDTLHRPGARKHEMYWIILSDSLTNATSLKFFVRDELPQPPERVSARVPRRDARAAASG